jgi:hypothetical protein
MLDQTTRCDDNENKSEWGRRATRHSPSSLGLKDPSSAMGGIPPSIAALVMRCKVLFSLSIQHIGGGLRWPLYCCISGPPLSLLPSNIEARALLKASLRCVPAAIFTCCHQTCFRRAPAGIFFCRHPNNASDAALPLRSFSAQCLCHYHTSAIF